MSVERREQTLEEFWKVEDFNRFLQWVDAWTRQRLTIKTIFLELQMSIWWSDPIKYLHDLYYGEKKSLDEILKVPEIARIKFFPKATLWRHLFEKFGWEPRPNTERTPVHERALDERIKSEIEDFEEKVRWLLHGRERKRVFKMSEFREKIHQLGKGLYILKTLGWINKQDLFDLSQNGTLSNTLLARALNKQLQDILEKFPELHITFEEVELTYRSIDRWFKDNTKKWNPNDE